jgi:hypothetical protein
LSPKDDRLLDIGAELELVFQEHGAEHLAVGIVHDIRQPVDDHQVAIFVDITGIAGVQPSAFQKFSRLFRQFVVAGRHRW